MNEEKLKMYLTILNDENPSYVKENAKANIIKLFEKQQKEIEFYKIQELGYIQGYEDGKSHKQTAVAIKNENAQQMLIQRKMEEYEKEIEKLKSRKYILNAETNEIKEIPISDDYISKDKIRKQIEEIKNCRLSTCDEQINKSLKEIYEIEDEICEYFEELLGE